MRNFGRKTRTLFRRRTEKRSETFDAIAIKLGRAGFVARGFVWACVGGVAVSAAFTGHQAEDQKGALDIVAANTAGFIVLIIATIGIFSYALWRFFEAWYELRIRSEDSKFKKFIDGYVTPICSGVFYIIFGVNNCFTIARRRREESDSGFQQQLTQHIGGRLVLTIAAVVLVGVAIGWYINLIRRQFKKDLEMYKLRQRKWVMYMVYSTCIIGTFGRGLLFILLAVLFARVAWDESVNYDLGFGGALVQLQNSTVGQVFLVFVGILLIIFGIFSLFQAKYKRFLWYKPELIPPDVKSKVHHAMQA